MNILINMLAVLGVLETLFITWLFVSAWREDKAANKFMEELNKPIQFMEDTPGKNNTTISTMSFSGTAHATAKKKPAKKKTTIKKTGTKTNGKRQTSSRNKSR